MKKKVNNKKGFTLAELLVVLAILAVLVAVAIPLFTGAISDAQKTAIDANVRAIRSAAVTEILSNNAVPKTGPWSAEAKISKSGEMTDLVVKQETLSSETIPSTPDGTYKISVKDVKTTTP